jgi:hypothetical protein
MIEVNQKLREVNASYLNISTSLVDGEGKVAKPVNNFISLLDGFVVLREARGGEEKVQSFLG